MDIKKKFRNKIVERKDKKKSREDESKLIE